MGGRVRDVRPADRAKLAATTARRQKSLRLPSKLEAELGLVSDSVGSKRPRPSRPQASPAKTAGGAAQRRSSQPTAHGGAGRRPAKKQARGPRGPGQHEADTPQGRPTNGAVDRRVEQLRDEIAQDLRYQASLAKRLKLKKGRTKTGVDDGLEDLLPDGLDDLLQAVLPPSLTGGLDGAAAGIESGESSGSDSDDAPDDDDEDDDDEDDEDDEGAQHPDDVERESSGAEARLRQAASDEGDALSESDDDSGGSERVQRETGGGTDEPQAAASAPKAARYVPPAARNAADKARQGGAQSVGFSGAVGGADEPVEHEAARRRVRSLVNRVALANVQGISSDVSDMMQQVPRHIVIDALVDTILQAIEAGPRAADQYASVAAALVAAVAAQARAQDLCAKFVLAVALALEGARARDDSIASANLIRVVCYLFICKVVGSSVVYSLLQSLKDGFTDGDVSLMLTVLNIVGFMLRSEDAAGMKEFVLSVHGKAAELGKEGALSQRARLMLDMVVDIKNNRKAHASGAQGGRMASLPPDLAKFVRSCGVEEVALHNLTWDKIVSCDKRGMWWLPRADERPAVDLSVAAPGQRAEEARLLKLAAAQRMNTETRRAVFCVLMAADDYMDAFERLLRLPLKGEAERDIVRVVLDCGLQEATWNPYYAHVAMKVASASKSHKMTLQYSIWDKLKALQDMPVRQLTNLAHFLALTLAAQSLPLTMLKVVDFADMTAKSTLFWRVCLRHAIESAADDKMLQQMFARLAAQGLSTLTAGLKLFICTKLGPWLSAKQPSELGIDSRRHDCLLIRVRMVEAALAKTTSVH